MITITDGVEVTRIIMSKFLWTLDMIQLSDDTLSTMNVLAFKSPYDYAQWTARKIGKR